MRADPPMTAVKLLGFAVLLAVIFVAAHAAGARLGPVTTSHSPVQYTGGTGGSPGGMNMTGANTGAGKAGGAVPVGTVPAGTGNTAIKIERRQ
jgi:hypothetical protein